VRIRQHTVKEKENFSQNALIGGSRSGRHLLQIPEKLSVLSWKSWCLAMEALGRIRLVVDGTQAAAGQREQSTSTYPINTRYDLHYSIATELGPNRSAARTPKQTHEEDKVEKCEARASHRRIRSGVSRIAPQPRHGAVNSTSRRTVLFRTETLWARRQSPRRRVASQERSKRRVCPRDYASHTGRILIQCSRVNTTV
jgi:hypothetical protein